MWLRNFRTDTSSPKEDCEMASRKDQGPEMPEKEKEPETDVKIEAEIDQLIDRTGEIRVGDRVCETRSRILDNPENIW